MRDTPRLQPSRRSAALLAAALALCLSGTAFSASPPSSTKDRLWMSTNYLQQLKGCEINPGQIVR
ncbi:hypothetical protein ACMHYJ_02225 [Castellaniella hirudinis]|uniref:hypothetical protein n=1 Tax=Castellaniella hirudinis TaxID=1144617 RepID=UPI0039C4DF67